jgi:drug/metabolite transporter (DMT)-like permease
MKQSAPNAPRQGASFALLAALLFGASVPFSKLLLSRVTPIMMAGLLYLGSGLGLGLYTGIVRRSRETFLRRADMPWLAGSLFFGGILAPLLLMQGLTHTPASSASLLLNLEGLFTALLAWFVFQEHFGWRNIWGMSAITLGGIVLSWTGRPEWGVPWGMIAIGGSCLCWAIDNNLTRKISAGDPIQIAAIKGIVAGSVNFILALKIGFKIPAFSTMVQVAGLGLFSYGVSLVFFILALRHIGAARTSAYFSIAPFFGGALSIFILGETPTWPFLLAAILMGIGVWLHLTEQHEHSHWHETLEHEHLHFHDEHHRHEHGPDDPSGEPHSHRHRHEPIYHSHPHFPDIHHRHQH